MSEVLNGLSRVFLDSAAVIYYFERHPVLGRDAILTNDKSLSRVTDLKVIQVEELGSPS